MKMRRGTCRNCQRLARRVAELERRLAAALARIEELERQLASARKDSSTSSKPPSSDIVKPPRPGTQAHASRRRKRRRGGQPGHERHARTPFGPEEVDRAWIYEWPACWLGADWKPLEVFSTVQQVELVEKLFEVTEYCARLYRHRRTGEIVAAPLPEDVVRAGLIGPRLSALIAYQKGACHMPYRVIATFLADVMHLPLSTGQLAKVVRKASAALAPSYAQLVAALPEQAVLNIDETGHPDSGQRLWTWGFHVPKPQGFTLFHIDPSRSSEVLKEFLGETFRGVVGCDYLSAYRKFLHDIGERFRQHSEHYFRFLGTPGVEPTNNAMEQRFRFVVIDRRITQGTRGETGRRWCERTWTVLATCAQQGRSAFDFLYNSIVAYLTKQPFPSLLPQPP